MIMLMQPRSNIHLKVLVVFVQFGSRPRAERWGTLGKKILINTFGLAFQKTSK